MATVSLASGMTLKPTSVQTATNENYVSALTTANLHKRDVSEDLVKVWRPRYYWSLELMGAKAPTSQTKYEHYEEAFLHNDINFSIDAAITGGAKTSTACTIDVDADSSGAADSIFNDTSSVRIGDILLLDDNTQVYVQAKASQTAFTIFPLTSAGYLTSRSDESAVNAVIIGNAFPEGLHNQKD